jgi:predicted membrane-bound spermidine synthase
MVSAPGRRLEAIVFVVGISTLGAEIAAARLLAPYFGASTVVWANTIGIVLVALSVGYWLGGRIADRRPHADALGRWIMIGALLLAMVPIVAKPLLSVSVDALDSISAGAFLGSLLAVTVLVAIPVMLLGAVAPWAIRLRLERLEDAGREAGRLYAISTLGSLLGTFSSALLLIPLVGTQRTFIVYALALVLAACAVLPVRWLLAPAAVAALLALPPGTTKPVDGARILHERETEHQYARVVELPDGERRLELNEGQAHHSVWRPDSVLTGNVWDGYLVLPQAALGRVARSVAILGNGAGTTIRAYGHYFPEVEIDGVEIDGELTEIGERYFELRERPGVRVITDDARPFLRTADRRYEAIFVDAYRQPYIPFYLTTKEFFELARDRLHPGGAVIVNAGHPEGSLALERVLAAGLRSAFPHVGRHPIAERNTLLIASHRRPTSANLERAAGGAPPELARVYREAAAKLEPAIADAEPYTDDRAPVEWLIDRSIVEYVRGR